MESDIRSNLTDATLQMLQGLIRINIDSAEEFAEAAKHASDNGLSILFLDISAQHTKNAIELQEYVKWNGETPRAEGSVAATLHRIWLNIRSRLSGGDRRVLLSNIEKVENHVVQAYDDALTETTGSEVHDVLAVQFESIRPNYGKVASLRDAAD